MDIWLISGISGAGKTTIGRRLAASFDHGVHIEADLLHEWIVAGGVLPGNEPEEEASRQMDLVAQAVGLLAASYAEAGFEVVIDYLIANPQRLGQWKNALPALNVHLVVLAPSTHVAIARDAARPKGIKHLAEKGVSLAMLWAHLGDEMKESLSDQGFWIDNSELSLDDTVSLIRANAGLALLDRRDGVQ